MSKFHKRILAFLILFFAFQNSFAGTYYISSEGNDTTGNGSVEKPWRSLFKATSSVSKPGDIIHVNPGYYREEQSAYLAIGVSIEGEGKESVIQATFDDEWMPILFLRSAEGTEGNQHISKLKFDGQNLSTFWCIVVAGRSNVSINNCIIQDFKDRGVIFDGRSDNKEIPPEVYATGNSFHDNIISNCSAYTTANGSYGRGALSIGGQDGMLIYKNHMSQISRPDGYNGFVIKYSNGGYLKNIKIFNNTIVKKPFTGMYGGDNGWDFAIELWNIEGGVEINNNIIEGAIDIVYSKKGKSSYGVWFHDNIVLQKQLSRFYESGIIFELSNEGAIVEYNIFNNISGCILFYAQKNTYINDVVIRKNILMNIGKDGGKVNIGSKGILLDCGAVKEGDRHFVADNISILENTLIGETNHPPLYGIEISGPENISLLNIRGNRFEKFLTAFIKIDPSSSIDTLLIQNNYLSGNGYNNNPLFINGLPALLSIKDNAKRGKFNFRSFSLKQQILRPLYFELKDISKLIIVGMFLLLLSVFLAKQENIFAFFPMLASGLIFSISAFSHEYIGLAVLSILFIIISIYGGVLWNNRVRGIYSRPQLRANDWKIYIISFVLCFLVIYFLLLYGNRFLPYNTIPLTDSISYAAALVGTWLLAKKKTVCWVFWMAAASVAVYGFYQKSLLISAFFSSAVFLLSGLGLVQWLRRYQSVKIS